MDGWNEARFPFTAGLLLRKHLVGQLEMYLGTQFGLEYTINELRKGWIDSDYIVTYKHKDLIKFNKITKDIQEYFKRLNKDDE